MPLPCLLQGWAPLLDLGEKSVQGVGLAISLTLHRIWAPTESSGGERKGEMGEKRKGRWEMGRGGRRISAPLSRVWTPTSWGALSARPSWWRPTCWVSMYVQCLLRFRRASYGAMAVQFVRATFHHVLLPSPLTALGGGYSNKLLAT